MDCRGKVAVITGGAEGIGRAVAKALLDKGAKGVTLFDINGDLGRSTCNELQEQYGIGRTIFVYGDVTKEEDLKACFQHTVDTFGCLDILLNSAGIIDEFDWNKMLLINLHGTIMASYTSVPYMGKMHGNHGGIIINVSSLAGVIGGNSWAPVYTASKFGVVGFSRAACNERLMAENGINICVICPWVVETRIKVISRQPDDVNSIYLNSRTIMPAEVANAVVGMIEDNCNGSVKLLMPGRAPIEVPRRRLKSLLENKL